VEAVDVLGRIDPLQHLLEVEPGRERRLHQDPVDPVVGVHPVDHLEHLALARRRRHGLVERLHPGLAARRDLVADVDLRRGVLADEDRDEPGPVARALLEGGRIQRNLGPNVRGDRLAVDDRRHGQRPYPRSLRSVPRKGDLGWQGLAEPCLVPDPG
jgi:hypothetical protein